MAAVLFLLLNPLTRRMAEPMIGSPIKIQFKEVRDSPW
jgi:hypothetical protein